MAVDGYDDDGDYDGDADGYLISSQVSVERARESLNKKLKLSGNQPDLPCSSSSSSSNGCHAMPCHAGRIRSLLRADGSPKKPKQYETLASASADSETTG